jgi:UDP-2-acetamido-3-amino-2,3-dideoxy-glucuronate N-acetyltransferase
VQVWEGVVLEDDVFVGPSAVFCNDRYPRSPRSEAAGDRYKAHDWCEGVVVGHGASIGANATVVCGVRIGRYALVAAGAVVTRSAPDFALVMGAPGRAAGWVCMCGRTLLGEGEMRCEACGRGYVEQGGALVNRA